MHSAETAIQEVQKERNVIKPLLKVGYFEQLTKRVPFNREITYTGSQEGAYFFSLEQRYARIPDHLKYESLKRYIDPYHQPRIENIWKKVVEAKDRWRKAALALEGKWKRPPDVEEDLSERVNQAIERIRQDYQKTAMAVVVPLPENDQAVSLDEAPDSSVVLSPLEDWKEQEKSLRNSYYIADKNYFLALRLYYEMLLERPQGTKFATRPPVLTVDFEGRKEIVKNNRYLRLIDAIHQASTISKAGHHEQKKRRLRKTEDVPYWFHPLRVMEMYALDVIPFIIEEEELNLDFIVGVAAAATHDLAEDTKFTPDSATQFLAERADKIDSSIIQSIETGFGLDGKEFGDKVLSLFKPKVRQRLRAILRVVSKNTPLYSEEQKKALEQNIAGFQKTLDIVGLNRGQLPFSYPEKIVEPSKTFTQFPEGEKKLDAFLVRLNVLTAGDRRRQALIIKLLDRADNLRTLQYTESKEGKKDSSIEQRKTLRSTVTRLIAWAMLDHDRENLPLYNALPRLIEVTLSEYLRFQNEFPEQMEANDTKYVSQLQEWNTQIQRHSLPVEAQKVVDEYNGPLAA